MEEKYYNGIYRGRGLDSSGPERESITETLDYIKDGKFLQ
jgi:hypothetical protein